MFVYPCLQGQVWGDGLVSEQSGTATSQVVFRAVLLGGILNAGNSQGGWNRLVGILPELDSKLGACSLQYRSGGKYS